MLQKRLDFASAIASAREFGVRKIALLATILAGVAVVILGAAWLLSKQDMDVAYVGLSPHDAPRLARVLRDSGFTFELSGDGTRLSTKKGDAAQLRAFLSERGLPGSSSVGYELFDKVGPLGLTSFMQEVTRVRALEGEIARSIQALRGVHAARVHIAVSDAGAGRRGRSPSSASVLVRADNAATLVQAIRNIVAASVPGLSASDVRIVGTDGEVLAAGVDDAMAGADRVLALEKALVRDLQAKIARTLTPLFGRDRFETTANVKLQIDKRQTQETTFDPAGRVERSVRTVRESGSQTMASSRNAVSVDRNIPGDSTSATAGDPTRRANQKRDEVTNYEIGSRSTASVVDGYRIEKLSVAVVLDAMQNGAANGASPAASINAGRLAEIEKLVIASIGADTARGDIVSVTFADFKRQEHVVLPEPTWAMWLERRSTLFIQIAVLFGLVAGLVVFGVRPAIRALEKRDPEHASALREAVTPVSLADQSDSEPPSPGASRSDARSLPRDADEPSTATIRRLIESDPKRAAVVLKRWIRQDA